MKLSNLRFILLAAIITVAAFVRIYQIGDIAPSLTWDEVAWGYNSYSLGIDGRDEFGVFLPYDYLESFGDFKPPLYAYVGIIPVKIWGLSEFATRFPSAFFGILTVLVTYFLVKEIFYKSKINEYYAIFSSFLLAISPWHINLSRGAFEANVAQFFIVSGLYFFLLAVRKNMWYLCLSSFLLVLSFYTFNTARVFVPIIVVLLGLIYIKKLWKHKTASLSAFFLGLMLLFPIIGFLFSPQASLRFKEVNIFTDPEVVEIANQEIENDGNSLVSKALHNRRLKHSVSFLTHYFDHFSPSFLFTKGDGNPKFSTQDVGQLYIWSIPFLIVGGFLIFRKREGKWWIVPIWLLTGIIPAATARETPHALRIETVLPMFQIFIAYGFVNTMLYFKSRIHKSWLFKLTLYGFLIMLIFNFVYYLYGYYVHYAREFSKQWQYGYKEALEFTEENKDKYDEIYFTDKLGRPYIYYLFYSKTTPQEFRNDYDVERDVFGFVKVKRVGKYNFRDYLEIDEKGKEFLYVNDHLNVPDDATVLKTINNLAGEPALVIYTR